MGSSTVTLPKPSRLYHGPLPAALWPLLEACHRAGSLAIQGDATRALASEVALAASMGWLTTIDPSGRSYGSRWRLTSAGLQALNNKEFMQ